MKPQTKQFKNLRDRWYKKLKDSGFEDIEQDEDRLKEYSTTRFTSGKNNKLPPDQIKTLNDSKEEYYRVAGHFLHEHEFNNEVDRFIWQKHAEGHSYRDITKMLVAAFYLEKDRMWTHNIISRLTKEMLEYYK